MVNCFMRAEMHLLLFGRVRGTMDNEKRRERTHCPYAAGNVDNEGYET
jgi:hypothetical protein